ncbi:MAG: methyltransferase domain-containing protein [Candidatus Woesearchaeota archaeon]
MKKIILFFIGGAINYGLKIGLTFVFTESLKIPYYLSYLIGLITVISFSFYYNFHVTFNNHKNSARKFIKYGFSLLALNSLDYSSVIFLTNLGIEYILSIIIVTSALSFMKYLLFNNLIFNDNPHKNIAGNYCDKENSKNPIIKYLNNSFKNMVSQLAKKTNAKNMLDIGCGEGYITNHLYNELNPLKIQGMDLEESAIKKARILHPMIDFNTGNIYNLNSEFKKYDLVIANEVLEHVEYPEQALDQLQKTTNRYCIISVPNEPFWSMANLLRLKYVSDLGNTPGHVQNWTRGQFRRLLYKYFDKIEMHTCGGLWNIALCEIKN